MDHQYVSWMIFLIVSNNQILFRFSPNEYQGKVRVYTLYNDSISKYISFIYRAPQTKEDYDKIQSNIRRVVDPETGRTRYV